MNLYKCQEIWTSIKESREVSTSLYGIQEFRKVFQNKCKYLGIYKSILESGQYPGIYKGIQESIKVSTNL